MTAVESSSGYPQGGGSGKAKAALATGLPVRYISNAEAGASAACSWVVTVCGKTVYLWPVSVAFRIR